MTPYLERNVFWWRVVLWSNDIVVMIVLETTRLSSYSRMTTELATRKHLTLYRRLTTLLSWEETLSRRNTNLQHLMLKRERTASKVGFSYRDHDVKSIK